MGERLIPAKMNPRKKISSLSGARTTTASQSNGGNQAVLYAATMTSGTIGRPNHQLSPSDKTASASNRTHQRKSSLAGTDFSARYSAIEIPLRSQANRQVRPMPAGAAP